MRVFRRRIEPNPHGERHPGVVRTRADDIRLIRSRHPIGHVRYDHFGLNGGSLTLAEVGAELRLSPARVRAIESDALHDIALELETAPAEP